MISNLSQPRVHGVAVKLLGKKNTGLKEQKFKELTQGTTVRDKAGGSPWQGPEQALLPGWPHHSGAAPPPCQVSSLRHAGHPSSLRTDLRFSQKEILHPQVEFRTSPVSPTALVRVFALQPRVPL